MAKRSICVLGYKFDFSCRNYHNMMCTTVLMCYTPLGFKYFTIDSPKMAEFRRNIQ